MTAKLQLFSLPASRVYRSRSIWNARSRSLEYADRPWIVGWLQTQDEFLEFCFIKLLGVGAIAESIERKTLRQKPKYDQL